MSLCPSGISEKQTYYFLLELKKKKVFIMSETDAHILKRMPLIVRIITEQAFPEPAEINLQIAIKTGLYSVQKCSSFCRKYLLANVIILGQGYHPYAVMSQRKFFQTELWSFPQTFFANNTRNPEVSMEML